MEDCYLKIMKIDIDLNLKYIPALFNYTSYNLTII